MNVRYSGFDDPQRWLLVEALAEQAQRRPNAPWLTFVDGEALGFGRAWDDAGRMAGYLASLGVGAGDRVSVLMGSSADFIRTLFGLWRLGAVAVLHNWELRGDFLSHQLRNAAARLCVVDGELAPAVEAVSAQAPDLERLLISGPAPLGDQGRLARLPLSSWRASEAHAGPGPRAADIGCVMYTSGTSGPAKGVLMPHAHCALFSIGSVECSGLTESDVYYVVLPLFHANGLLMQVGASLMAGCPAVVRARFSASAWLPEIRAHGVTVTHHLGATAAFTLAQPETPLDRDHRLRAVMNEPNVPAHEKAFRERFGVRDVVSGFGMTEVNIPIWGRIGRPAPGAAGWVQPRYELIIADPATDLEVPRGQLGEILVRPKIPFAFMQGYLNMPERTVEAWRNLWFHTGDAAIMDETGLVTFVDRIKDTIRRRGENIAAAEVEALVATLPGVAEVAACAVASDIVGGEDELLLAVIPRPGVRIDPADLGAQAEALLPRFARPRFIRIVESLPMTATGKVSRAELRKAGSTGAFDREAEREARR